MNTDAESEITATTLQFADTGNRFIAQSAA